MLPVLSMRWEHVLFLHWPVEPERVAASLPDGLDVTTHDGRAWLGVVAFTMPDIRPRGSPVGLDFHEVNLRTYVRPSSGGPKGVYFYNLDAEDWLGVVGARTLFRLPYYHAEMRLSRIGTGRSAGERPGEAVGSRTVERAVADGDVESGGDIGADGNHGTHGNRGPDSSPRPDGTSGSGDDHRLGSDPDPDPSTDPGLGSAGRHVPTFRFLSRRDHPTAPDARVDLVYRPTGDPAPSEPGSLDEFLAENYRFYTGGRPWYCEIDHDPWPLQTAAVTIRENGLFEANGFDRPDGEPRAHYTAALDVTAGRLHAVDD